MPIKPENRARYPEDWEQIRQRVLERAGHACEICRVANYARIARGVGTDAGRYLLETGAMHCAETGAHLGQRAPGAFEHLKWIRIVLTIAHLDHVPEHVQMDNLRALCQLHHLRHDQELHVSNAAATREARRARWAISDLFEHPVSERSASRD